VKSAALSLAGLLAAGLVAIPAMAQQNASQAQPQTVQPQTVQPPVRQRAPGVPMAPRRDVAGLRAGQGDVRPEQRAEAERTLPIPRGVGSIIAP
jgi:hypothetical protein